MLTPIEIQGKVFKTGIGYDKKDVEAFIKEVLVSFEQLYKENVELNDKLGVLSEGIQYYKTIEKTLQKALILAEKTSEDTKNAAEKEAKLIEEKARNKAKIIIGDAKSELDQINLKTINLVQQYEKYKAQFKHLAAAQVDLLDSECFNISLFSLNDDAVQNDKDMPEADKETNKEKTDFLETDTVADNESSLPPIIDNNTEMKENSSDISNVMIDISDGTEAENEESLITETNQMENNEEKSLYDSNTKNDNDTSSNNITEKEFDDSFQFVSYDD